MAKTVATVAEVVELPAMRLEQAGTKLYVTHLTAGDLSKGSIQVDAWSPTNTTGYQRMPIKARFRKIARYAMGKEGGRPILPQAIVLNVREVGVLEFEDSGTGLGRLRIPHGTTLWEVDGQHRIGGLRYAVEQNPDFKDYTVPVVITEGLSRLEEAVLFFVINTTQKRVPTDLAQRIIEQEMGDEVLKLKLVAEGKDWIPLGTKIVDVLLQTPGHPWYGRIGVPGTRLAGVQIKQVSFVTSLKPILVNSIYSQLEPEEIAQLLIRYWQAWEEVCPEAFQAPDEYVIQKTVGVFPLHMIAAQVFDMVRSEKGRITKDGIVEVIRALDRSLGEKYESGSAFWHAKVGEAGKYAGAKGFRIIAEILREHLPETKKIRVL
jgi:DGQHR domain-containing protein